jgi:hypothetical protein
MLKTLVTRVPVAVGKQGGGSPVVNSKVRLPQSQALHQFHWAHFNLTPRFAHSTGKTALVGAHCSAAGAILTANI